MKSRIALLVLLCCGGAFATDSAATSKSLNTEGIAKALGKPGETIGGGAYKVSFPRSELRVTAGSVAIKPGLALTNWAAFKRSGDAAMTYGDLALLDSEVNPVISRLEEGGIEVSALHNHLLHENPRILFIHFMGTGDEIALARGLRHALELTTTPLETKPAAREEKPAVAREIERVLGAEGSMGGGVLHVTVPRNDLRVTMDGAEIPSSMGMNISLNFQIEGSRAAINGDFMLRAGEVNPVIKALRTHGIEIAALHNHMLDEEPRLFFMHFWAFGDAVELAKGLKSALDVVAR